jgi:hypothetical protein
MVVASWEKMHRRVTHIYSRDMLSILVTLTPQNMQSIFKAFAPKMKLSLRRDSSLAATLVSLDEQEALERVLDVHLQGYQASMESQPGGIKSLVEAFQTTLSSQPQEGMGAYNEKTCFPFHLLLVATITGFTESLVSLYKASTVKDDEYAQLVGATSAEDHEYAQLVGAARAADRQKYAQHVVQFGRLLRHIAYSQMLTLHLELLEAGNFLRTPSKAHSDRMGKSAPGDGGGKDEDKDDEDEDDEVAEELRQSEKDKAVTFRRWIQLLVSYWAAIDTLAKFSTHQGTKDANITLIHVRGELDRKMAPWDATIRRLASLPTAADSKDPFDPQAAIASFTK